METRKENLVYDGGECLKAFLKGEDQSWDLLMGLVEANAKKAAITKSESKFVEWQVRC